MNGTIGPSGEIAMEFGKVVEEELKIKVEFWDERLTTVAAHKTMNYLGIKKEDKKNIVDTISAIYILETYMNKKK